MHTDALWGLVRRSEGCCSSVAVDNPMKGIVVLCEEEQKHVGVEQDMNELWDRGRGQP